jgi:2-polyprenyl-6-methoxyphenol hydroxylase-like FAD-dependent oxidoreductase
MSADVETADVVIVGAGPTGLMLAIELCLGGVTPVVLEQLADPSEIPKGNGFFGLIVPVLDYRGLLEPLRADATYTGPAPQFFFGPLQLTFSLLAVSPLQILALPQRQIERKLAERLEQLGGTVRRGHELTGFSQHDDGVTVEVRSAIPGPGGSYQLRAGYVAGCDGAHSAVRKLAGIDFPGVTSGTVARIGRVRVPKDLIVSRTGELDVPGAGRLPIMRQVPTPRGMYTLGPQASVDKTAPRDAYIVSTHEEQPDADLTAPMTLDELRASVRRVLGVDLPMSEPTWLTRLAGNSRQADRYREGRILLAGDAAHVFGLGGSLNAALLDALNLGWKLAAEVRGGAPAGLLDSYHTERHTAGQRSLLQSRAQRALQADDPYTRAIRELVGELLGFAEPQRHVGELIAGSDVRYDMTGPGQTGPAGGPHPLTGRLAPDLSLKTADGRTRVAELMRAARPVLLDFTTEGRVAAAVAGWDGPVTILTVKPGEGAPPADGLLIRPDCYVAWATGPGAADPAAGLTDALRTWCGQPTRTPREPGAPAAGSAQRRRTGGRGWRRPRRRAIGAADRSRETACRGTPSRRTRTARAGS